jgi:hypothetical protein
VPSLQHLIYSGERLEASGHLASLTALTSLTINLSSWMSEHLLDLGQVLGLLAWLSSLESLSLAGKFRDPPGGYIPEEHVAAAWGPGGGPAPAVAADAAVLPPWPRLRHLNLAEARPFNSAVFRHRLQLSLHHCARLESLSVADFQAPAGVMSMPQLTSLRLVTLPWGQLDAAGAAGEQPPQQALCFPQLKTLRCFKTSSCPIRDGIYLHDALALAAESCPVLEELDVSETFSPVAAATPAPAVAEAEAAGAEQMQAARQSIDVLIAREQPLRSLYLPGKHRTFVQATNGLLAALAQDGQRLGQLRELHIYQPLPSALWPALGSCTALLDLELQYSGPEVLLHLPLALTSLTLLYGGNTCGAEPGPALLAQRQSSIRPPLRRLECRWDWLCALQVLQLSQLTGLTSLWLSSPLGAQAPAVSRLVRLVEARFHEPWEGMAAQLRGLRQLRSLRLGTLYVSAQSGALERQPTGLATLTQLRELVVGDHHSSLYLSQDAVRAVQAMPAHCMVRLGGLVMKEHELEHQGELFII